MVGWWWGGVVVSWHSGGEGVEVEEMRMWRGMQCRVCRMMVVSCISAGGGPPLQRATYWRESKRHKRESKRHRRQSKRHRRESRRHRRESKRHRRESKRHRSKSKHHRRASKQPVLAAAHP